MFATPVARDGGVLREGKAGLDRAGGSRTPPENAAGRHAAPGVAGRRVPESELSSRDTTPMGWETDSVPGASGEGRLDALAAEWIETEEIRRAIADDALRSVENDLAARSDDTDEPAEEVPMAEGGDADPVEAQDAAWVEEVNRRMAHDTLQTLEADVAAWSAGGGVPGGAISDSVGVLDTMLEEVVGDVLDGQGAAWDAIDGQTQDEEWT
jgi:hypothetical protein